MTHPLTRFRQSRRWSQTDLAERLGLKSRSQIADFERSRQRVSAELAIEIDRLSDGAVPVAELRPDLHDVRVIHASADHSGASA